MNEVHWMGLGKLTVVDIKVYSSGTKKSLAIAPRLKKKTELALERMIFI